MGIQPCLPFQTFLKGDIVCSTLDSKEGKTTPPKHYTEGTLITAMKDIGKRCGDEEQKEILDETEGIGTEATRANIIESLKHQKYIFVKGNKIYVTEKGITLCETLKGNEITNAELTAKWEKDLEGIKEQNITQHEFLKRIYSFINTQIVKAPGVFCSPIIEKQVKKIQDENAVGICPICKGEIQDKGKFYGCSGYRENNCRFTLPKK